MKKYLLILFVLPKLAFGQFSKGQVFLGGTISTVLQNSDAKASPNYSTITKNNSLSLSPSLGFFLNDKIAVGANLGYSTSLVEYDYLNNFGSGYVNAFQKNSSNSYGIGSFIRYYVPVSNSFYFALHGQLSFNRITTKTVYDNGTTETTDETPSYSLSAIVRPVFIFFPSPKWGIEASIGSLGFTRTKYLPDVSASSTFGLSAGSLGLGVTYYFSRK